MAETYIRPEDVSPEDAQKVLDFLNAAQSANEIADAVEIPDERDVGIKVAQRILDRRNQLGSFTSLQQVAEVLYVGPERFTEIVITLRETQESTVVTGGTSTVNYASSDSVFTNPERGFYHHTETHSNNYTPLDLATLQGYRQNENISLILRVFYLDDFVNSAISNDYLNKMQADFDIIRDAGSKVIVRFAYVGTWPPTVPYVDATKTQVLAHLDQLKPSLQNNKDVILVMQAGFIGYWGEWYYTDHFVEDPTKPGEVKAADYANRGEVLDKILNVLPADRMVQTRTPLNKQKIYNIGTGTASALPEEDAHNGSDIARSGHHNDCFLASDDDFGTYADIDNDKNYLEQETRYLPMGGESCNNNPPRSQCPTALAELQRFHWSYINWDYHLAVRCSWETDGCIDEIKRKLGYRFRLISGEFTNRLRPGDTFELDLQLQNDGWAAPFNPRKVEIVLRNTFNNSIYTVELPEDPRFWFSGETVNLQATVGVPTDIPVGSYEILLNLPDPDPELHDRAEYATRFANENAWEDQTGYNRLDYTLVISAAASGTPYEGTLWFQPKVVEGYGWLPVASLNTARRFHTTTLLLDGRVLVAGGSTKEERYSNSVEIYDPASDAWNTVAPLNIAHRDHTATLLTDGRVLIVGGMGYGTNRIGTAEIYDPASGSWQCTGSLNIARSHHTATLLPNGKVLVVGGLAEEPGELGSTEIYDPETGTWTLTGTLISSRWRHTATLLSDGRVLITGGARFRSPDDPDYPNEQILNSVEIYDPVSGMWSAANSLLSVRAEHIAALLADGRVLVAGGWYDFRYYPLISTEIYDPESNAWSSTGSLAQARGHPEVILLADGRVLVVGGWYDRALASVEIYDPANNAWSPSQSLFSPRSYHTLTLLHDNRVLLIGGEAVLHEIVNTVEVFVPE